MKGKRVNREFTAVSHDITGGCNLNCKFCINDPNVFSKSIMPPEIFMKTMEIMPFAKDESFYLSCLFEPSYSPYFETICGMIPEEYRQKVFFTTNLAKRLTDNQIHALAASNLNHINISIQTFNQDLYTQVMGTSSSFYINLKNVADIFSQYQNPPELRYITMLLQCNKDEIESIINLCSKEYLGAKIEIRTPYLSDSVHNNEWMDSQWVKHKDIIEIEKVISKYPNVVYDLTMYYEKVEGLKKLAGACKTNEANELSELVTPATAEEATEDINLYNFYTIRIYPDGTGYIPALSEGFDLKNITDCTGFFSSVLKKLVASEKSLYKTITRPSFVQWGVHAFNILKKATWHVDDFIIYSGEIAAITGWAVVDDPNLSMLDYYLCINDSVFVKAKRISRPDVVENFKCNYFDMSGFEFNFAMDIIDRDDFNVKLVIVDSVYKVCYWGDHDRTLTL